MSIISYVFLFILTQIPAFLSISLTNCDNFTESLNDPSISQYLLSTSSCFFTLSNQTLELNHSFSLIKDPEISRVNLLFMNSYFNITQNLNFSNLSLFLNYSQTFQLPIIIEISNCIVIFEVKRLKNPEFSYDFSLELCFFVGFREE